MSSTVPFPIASNDKLDPQAINIEKARQQYIGEVSHLGQEQMPPRRIDSDTEDRLDRMERILERTLEATEKRTLGYNGERKRSNWMMAGLAIITIVGSTGSFIGQSGMFVGGKLERSDRLEKDLQGEKAARETMQARLDNLRTLYLIRFGEDPDKVTPETMNRRLQQQVQRR